MLRKLSAALMAPNLPNLRAIYAPLSTSPLPSVRTFAATIMFRAPRILYHCSRGQNERNTVLTPLASHFFETHAVVFREGDDPGNTIVLEGSSFIVPSAGGVYVVQGPDRQQVRSGRFFCLALLAP